MGVLYLLFLISLKNHKGQEIKWVSFIFSFKKHKGQGIKMGVLYLSFISLYFPLYFIISFISLLEEATTMLTQGVTDIPEDP